MTPKYKRVWIGIKKSHPQRWKRGWKKLAKPPTWRQNIKRNMDWALRHEDDIHYDQHRPFNPMAIAIKRLPLSADCSGAVTMLYRAVHRPDPNGLYYSGQGYTGTMRWHTPKRRTLKSLRVGDFIVYGHGEGEHVVAVYKAGKNPTVWSHGQEAGPWITSHSQQVAAHGGYFTLHNGGKL